MTVLLDNVNVDTISDVYDGNGGPAVLVIHADDFGGGKVFIETSRRGANKWITIKKPSTIEPPPDLGVDWDDNIEIALPIGLELRVQLLGSTTASNVRVEVLQ